MNNYYPQKQPIEIQSLDRYSRIGSNIYQKEPRVRDEVQTERDIGASLTALIESLLTSPPDDVPDTTRPLRSAQRALGRALPSQSSRRSASACRSSPVPSNWGCTPICTLTRRVYADSAGLGGKPISRNVNQAGRIRTAGDHGGQPGSLLKTGALTGLRVRIPPPPL